MTEAGSNTTTAAPGRMAFQALWRQKIKEKIEVLKAKLSKESDQPRVKTEGEIEEDYKRIESKDRALLAALDAPAPKPTDD